MSADTGRIPLQDWPLAAGSHEVQSNGDDVIVREKQGCHDDW
jgi:hypothetical protein